MVIIVMGVSGAGKTTIGRLLAGQLGWQFRDADDFHSASNKAKMNQGLALSDADRMPWLQGMAKSIAAWLTSGEDTVLACSALKHRYRALLSDGHPQVAIVYLRADFEAIAARLANRADHFMNKDLLQSQFATLEEPEINQNEIGGGDPGSAEDPGSAPDEAGKVIVVDGTQPPATIVSTVRHSLNL